MPTSAENRWIVDGVDTTGVFKGQQGKSLSMEFISEVEVKTDGYWPEYGRRLGGVINVVTKSGGNQFHGDGFVYSDSSATTARQVFYSGVDSPSGSGEMRAVNSKRFDYGFDLGGFILRDRLWFFAAYDRVALQSEVSRAEATPDVSTEDRFPFDTTDNLYSGKLTWNVSSATSIIANTFADPSDGFRGRRSGLEPAGLDLVRGASVRRDRLQPAGHAASAPAGARLPSRFLPPRSERDGRRPRHPVRGLEVR